MLGKRIATAVVGLPAVVFIIRGLPPAAFFVLMLLVIAAALIEFYGMALPAESRRTRALCVLLGCCVPAAVFFESLLLTGNPAGAYYSTTGCCVLCMAVLFFYFMFAEGTISDSINRIAAGSFGIVYVALLLSYLILLRARSDGPALLLLLISITWAGDTGAYAVGRLIGKHPLCPRISPKKTIEGAAGSCAVSVLTALACRALFFESLSLTQCLILGLGINLLNQFGDLTESFIKRACNAKDSGVLLPGHGGMLDRIDSLLFAAPFLFHYMHSSVPAS
jgi:phosphatidate cytidylyltransferase